MKQKYQKYLYLTPSILWILSIAGITFFAASHILDSDMSAELVLAKQLASEHKLLTTEWFYSTEIRIVNTQLIAVPLFLLCDSFRIVRTAQCLILHLLLLWSYLYCMKQLNVREKARYLSSMFLFVPFSMTFAEIVQIGNFYIPHYIFLFVMLGFTVSCCKKLNVFRLVVYLVLSFLCGLSSVRYPLMIQFPLLAAALLTLYRDAVQADETIFAVRTLKKPYFWLPLSGLVLSVFGYGVNEKILHRIFSFRSNAKIPLTDFSKSNLADRLGGKISDIFKLFGYWDGHSVISLSGICSMFAVGITVLIVCMVILLLRDRKAMDRYQYLAGQMFVMSFLIATFVYVFSNGFYQPRYYITALVLFVPVFGIFLDRNSVQKKDLCRLISGALSAMLLFNGFCSAFWICRYDDNASKKAVCGFLKERNLNFGYASFWNGAVITELSNGAITMVNIKDFPTMMTDNWLMAKKYAKDNILENLGSGRCFILMTAEEYQSYNDCEILKGKKLIYDTDAYKIIEFP